MLGPSPGPKEGFREDMQANYKSQANARLSIPSSVYQPARVKQLVRERSQCSEVFIAVEQGPQSAA